MTRVFPLLLAAVLAGPGAAHAQQDSVVIEKRLIERETAGNPGDARRVQMELRQLLMEHPPNLRIVLQADPSLAERAEYLAPYPRLVAFIKQHPEVVRNPTFFFGQPDFGWFGRDVTPQERAVGAMQEVLAGMGLFIGVLTVVLVLASLIRQAIGHRRWIRQSRVQTEVHTKILDRLQSNEDLLAYIQSPAGQQFLESGPSARPEPAPRAIGIPANRILWSVQAGVMLMALGIGFWLVQRNTMAEIAPAFAAMGTVAVVLGVGAVVSAGVAYTLSSRLGLIGTPKD
jgi:hypothetical protein